mgnify:CR=1 FL=1
MAEMNIDEKLDYLIELVEDLVERQGRIEEAQDDLIEKVADLGTPFGSGFEIEQ